MVFVRNSLIASAMALMFSVSDAHVTLNPKFVESKQNLTTAFHVPHGCGNFSTTAIMATVPQGPTSVVPQQVANWVRITYLQIHYLIYVTDSFFFCIDSQC